MRILRRVIHTWKQETDWNTNKLTPGQRAALLMATFTILGLFGCLALLITLVTKGLDIIVFLLGFVIWSSIKDYYEKKELI